LEEIMVGKKFNELPFNARPDLTPYLLHLTKGKMIEGKRRSAYDNLVSILQQGKIVASQRRGFIKGGQSATCFMDVPFASMKYVLTPENRDPNKPRYEPYGICLLKRTAYGKGSRPVLYLSDQEIIDLKIPQSELWRVVKFEVQDENWISWLHEREWRCKGDMKLPAKLLAVFVKSAKEVEKLQKKIATARPGTFKTVPLSIIPFSIVCQGFLPLP
jgi:hypothetical protein